jgi:vitamin K-dependent gamma-carboxylase
VLRYRRDVRDELNTEVDPSSLAILRIALGVILVWGVWRVFDSGDIATVFLEPTYLFRWWLFDWVRPLPGPLLYVAFAAIGVAAALFAAGLYYRVAAVVLAAGLAYWFLLEKGEYLNHKYLATLLALLFVLMPAHAALSIDALRKGWSDRKVGAWTVWLFRFQVSVPYFFAGIAKMNYDWMVRAEPIGSWLAAQTDFPFIGRSFTQSSVVHAMAWGSMLFDLTIVFFLLNRRTRAPAYGVALIFHFMNSRLFGIGIFPWMMIVATSIFFEPDWPKRMSLAFGTSRLARRLIVGGFCAGFAIGGFLPRSFVPVCAVIGGFGVAVLVFHLFEKRLLPWPSADVMPVRTSVGTPIVAFVALWVLVQLVVPLRHWFIPGNVAWTEEGQRFSWQMLLNNKSTVVGFLVTDPASGKTWREDYSEHLTQLQVSRLGNFDMIFQFAHHLEDIYRARGLGDVEVRVRARCALNGRELQWMIDQRIDLTRYPRPYIPPADWILPLKPISG